MPELTLNNIKPAAAEKIKPFLDDILSKFSDNIHSIHVTGSSVTDDYDEKSSDVNTLVILKEMDLKFLEIVAPLGKKYRKHGVAAPLIMTPGYISSSLDVFPIEFLNFRLIHENVYGADILKDVEIDRMDLRHQCERELKTKLIWLRQGYISSLGDRKLLTDGFVSSIAGYIPLFRSIIVLLGKEPPVMKQDVISTLSEAAQINTDIFAKVLREKRGRARLSADELNTIFEDYYTATENLGKIVDELQT